MTSLTAGTASARADVSPYRTAEPHPAAAGVPEKLNRRVAADPERYIGDLVRTLTKGITDPFEQVKILHDWTALNIAYDTDSFFSGNIPQQALHQVFSTGKGVCDGYSTVFKALCDTAGICWMLPGTPAVSAPRAATRRTTIRAISFSNRN